MSCARYTESDSRLAVLRRSEKQICCREPVDLTSARGMAQLVALTGRSPQTPSRAVDSVIAVYGTG